MNKTNSTNISVLLITCCVLVVCFQIAAGEEGMVEWKPRWEVGDKFTVEMIRLEKQIAFRGKGIEKDKTIIDISVMEKGDDFYVIHWTCKEPEVYKSGKADFSAVESKNLLSGFTVKIKTDRNGKPYELLNAKELETLGVEADILKLHDIRIYFLFCSMRLKIDEEITIKNPLSQDQERKATVKLKKYKQDIAEVSLHQKTEKTSDQKVFEEIEYKIDTRKSWPIFVKYHKKTLGQGRAHEISETRFRTIFPYEKE